MPVPGFDHNGIGRIHHIVGRHDLDALFMEDILNVRMEFRKDL